MPSLPDVLNLRNLAKRFRTNRPPAHIQFDPWTHSLDDKHRPVLQPTQLETDPAVSSYKYPPAQRSAPRRRRYHKLLCCYLVLPLSANQPASALHHMKRAPIAYVARRDESKPLVIRNLCEETIYPGIVTQSGDAPSVGGFRLDTGDMKNLTVGASWQGRVWGRTNCSFNGQGTGPSNNGGFNGGGRACVTGDCGGIVDCKATVSIHPITKEKLHLMRYRARPL